MMKTGKQKSELEITRFSLYDGIDYKKALFLNKSFPMHFHHEWSLSLIEAGSEILMIDHKEIQLNAGAIILIAPGVAHANRGNPDAFWRYRSLYLHHDTWCYLLKKTGLPEVLFSTLKYHVFHSERLKKILIEMPQSACSEIGLEQKISFLFTEVIKDAAVRISGIEQSRAHYRTSDIIYYLHQHLEKKITLDYLAKIFVQDKFRLMRQFKHSTGLSPQEYLTSLRVEHSKKLLQQTEPISAIALESGFYDQSHFSNIFRKFVGISPGEYRKHCNILQDNERGPL